MKKLILTLCLFATTAFANQTWTIKPNSYISKSASALTSLLHAAHHTLQYRRLRDTLIANGLLQPASATTCSVIATNGDLAEISGYRYSDGAFQAFYIAMDDLGVCLGETRDPEKVAPFTTLPDSKSNAKPTPELPLSIYVQPTVPQPTVERTEPVVTPSPEPQASTNAASTNATLHVYAPYAVNKADLETFMQLVVQGDDHAEAEMIAEEKVGLAEQDEAITVTTGLGEYVSFRFKGSAHLYWTMNSFTK
jgi:hypothetical protein